MKISGKDCHIHNMTLFTVVSLKLLNFWVFLANKLAVFFNRILNLAKNTMNFLIKDKRQILLIFITMFSGKPKRVSNSQPSKIEPEK